uniref:Circadian-associated transcriptional repressor-like n=2 Tax=Astyanax mexicanus TaxID=7994 RepID=A0A3B1IXV4_ASTMX
MCAAATSLRSWAPPLVVEAVFYWSAFMQTSSQPPLDTPSSRDSFLFSDDDSEVFLSEESEGRSSQSVYSLDGGLESPGSQWARDGFGEGSEVSGGHRRPVFVSDSSFSFSSSSSSSSSSGLGWSGTENNSGTEKEKGRGTQGTQGDVLFAQKCLELQGFIRPLLDLLNGLKKGRFDKGLSSFQQSVAMDRIQRIVGVLQKPHIGEKYLPTLLQIEMMLKVWFPQVILHPSEPTTPKKHSEQSTSVVNTPPHKHKDQLHIPVKKRRLSWSDTDSTSATPPVVCKQVKGQFKASEQEKEERGESSGSKPHRDQSEKRQKTEGETSGHKAIHWSEPSLTWVHIAPILSPPKSCPSHEAGRGSKHGGRGYVLLTIPPPTSRCSPATQDSSISSTTPYPEPVGCQNQQNGTEKTDPVRGREQSPPITTQPSSRAELRPLET